jgi:hypothetical protein
VSRPHIDNSEKVRFKPSVKVISFIFIFGTLVVSISAFENGILSIGGLLSTLCFLFGVPYFFFYIPNKYTSLSPEGVVEYEAFGVGGVIPWERVKRASWGNISRVSGIFGFLPPKWVHVNGEYLVENNGMFESSFRKEGTVQLPMSPFPWIMSGIADEAIDYVCERVSSDKIRPEVIQYLKRRGLYDPERHPKLEECKGRR